MYNYDIVKIEKALGFKLKRNTSSLGIDTASTTGIALLQTTEKKLTLQVFLYKVPKIPKDTEDKSEKYGEVMNMVLLWARDFIKQQKIKKQDSVAVLENSYMGFNAWTYGFLKALMGILYSQLYDYFDTITIKFATAARKAVGFQTKLDRSAKREAKKEEIICWVDNIFHLKERSDDMADAIILSLVGLKRLD